jgi:5'(3')-deoxyribonucleotidase
MAQKLTIYIDMDHTFCDFENHKKTWQKFAHSPIEKQFPWSMRGFFETLPPMQGALDFWEYWADKCDLYFLTRPSVRNRHSYTEKANWVFKHLGQDALEKLILSPKKDLLKGDILIDDYGGNGQSTFEGEWWKFGSDEFPDWTTCHNMLETKFETKKNKLIYERNGNLS